MSFTEQEFAERQARIRERMRAEGFDALVAYSTAKVRGCVRYLSSYYTRWTGAQAVEGGGYHQFGSCALLFGLEGEPILLTDQPWDVDRAKLVSVVEDTRYAGNFGDVLGPEIAARGYERVGIDNWFVFPAYHYLRLVEHAPNAAFDSTALIEDTYKVKTPGEIELIRKAQVAAIKGVEAGTAAVGVGVREYDFAVAAENAMRLHGELEGAANNVIGGGPNTATGTCFPTQADSYVMKSGDLALFDLTPSYDDYAGDISRTVVAGSLDDLDPLLRGIYETALRTIESVIEAIRPGVTPLELTNLAIEIADEAGHGEYRSGLLGHSMGIDIHDPPDYYYDPNPLEENMTITVEPFLGVPGLGGVRIEDTVLVTADGCEVLSADCPRELRATG
ncbi:MAG: M24 family metallopeptidase [Solirubrobacterales bacterium]